MMQTNLVTTNKQGVVTDSLTVAEKFGKRHKDVLKKIENILRDDEDTRLNFAPSEYKDPTGRSLKKYIMDRKSFSILCMSFSGKKALNWKIKFYDAFEAMEKALLQQAIQQNDFTWISQRQAGKIIHREKTDVIKDFIEYAIKQGGSVNGCKNYYSNIARMENNALFILEQKFKNLRDILNLNQLATITSADGIARKAIKEGMAANLHYKEIYQLARNRVAAFAELHGKTFIPATQEIEYKARANS
jgi:Rha family phage regulatory protein